MQLLGVCHSSTILSEFHRTGLVDARHVGAIDFIFAVIGEDHPRTRTRQIHILGGSCLVVTATLVDVIENNRRGYLAGDVHPVQHQGHYRFGIFFGIFAQIHGNLSLRQFTTKHVLPRLGDMHHGVGVCLRLGVGVLFLALTIGEILTALVVHNIVGNIHRRCVVGGNSLTIHGDTLVGQLNAHTLIDLLGVVKHLCFHQHRRLGGGCGCGCFCFFFRRCGGLFATADHQSKKGNQNQC